MKTIKNRRWLQLALISAFLFIFACVTVNIYFPAAQVEKAAEEIVSDVYGTPRPEQQESEVPDKSSSLVNYLAELFSPGKAHAQDATTVSNAAIRGLKEKIAQNHQQLLPFYERGNVGITNTGYLSLRNTDDLGVQQVAQLKRLVQADNEARQQLYRAVAEAMNIDPSQVGKIEEIFAKEWQSKAGPTWWIQKQDGSWTQK